jgi:hypothetical protein
MFAAPTSLVYKCGIYEVPLLPNVLDVHLHDLLQGDSFWREGNENLEKL